MRIRSAPFWISLLIHGTVMGIGSFFFVRPPEFAMDTGHNSVEVNLVAAEPDPVPPAPVPPPPPETEEPTPPQPPKPDDVQVPVAPPLPPTPPPPQPAPPIQTPLPPTPPRPHHTPTLAKGDGSAPKPGKDATTASSDSGAIRDVAPDYLSNPPPLYPESARRGKQQGLVMLEVIINENGRAESVSIQSSSGYGALDQSAVTAVRKWRFRPASMGSIKIKSRALVPIHFQLSGQ